MNDFPHPLNTVIEEEIEIPSFEPTVNEKKSRVEFKETTQKATRKTIYIDQSNPTKVICNKHKYACINKGKSIFKCTKCDWHRIALPVTFKFDEKTGILTYRKTGIRI